MNLTQGALFRHFPSKEAIRLAVIEWIGVELMQRLKAARDAAPDPLHALQAMFSAHVAFILAFPGAPRCVFAELQDTRDSPVRKRVRGIMQVYRRMVAGVLDEARIAHQVRDDIDIQAAAALFLGGIQGVVIQSLLGGERPALEEQALAVLQLYLVSLESRS